MNEEMRKMEKSESGSKSENLQVQEKKAGAKVYSKFAMIFSSVWIAGLTILKALKVFEINETDIIYSGISIVAVWSPTYLSIWLDKIKDIRFGS